MFSKKLTEFTCSTILLLTSIWILSFKCNQFLFCAATVKPCFAIIWFNLYAAFIPTEEASFTAQSIIDSQKPCLGEENSQETIEHSRNKLYFTNI
jgi:hypothetical protein